MVGAKRSPIVHRKYPRGRAAASKALAFRLRKSGGRFRRRPIKPAYNPYKRYLVVKPYLRRMVGFNHRFHKTFVKRKPYGQFKAYGHYKWLKRSRFIR